MSVHILIDSRWAGNTGIGNLYQEVMARMPPLVIPAFVESRMSLGHLCSPLMLARETARSKPDLFYSPSFMRHWPGTPPDRSLPAGTQTGCNSKTGDQRWFLYALSMVFNNC